MRHHVITAIGIELKNAQRSLCQKEDILYLLYYLFNPETGDRYLPRVYAPGIKVLEMMK